MWTKMLGIFKATALKFDIEKKLWYQNRFLNLVMAMQTKDFYMKHSFMKYFTRTYKISIET